MGCFSSAPRNKHDEYDSYSADRQYVGFAGKLPDDIMDLIWNFVGFDEPIWGNVLREKPKICSAGKLDWLITKTPKVLHCFDWTCHYCTQRDGTSMITFREKVSIHSETLLIIKDKDQTIFGVYSNKPWKRTNSFSGDSKNFLFSFPEEGIAQIFRASGENNLYQKIDKDTMFLGGTGADKEGKLDMSAKCGLFLTGNFSRGHSSGNNATYSNTKSLAKKEDFDVLALEVWGPVYWDDSDDGVHLHDNKRHM